MSQARRPDTVMMVINISSRSFNLAYLSLALWLLHLIWVSFNLSPLWLEINEGERRVFKCLGLSRLCERRCSPLLCSLSVTLALWELHLCSVIQSWVRCLLTIVWCIWKRSFDPCKDFSLHFFTLFRFRLLMWFLLIVERVFAGGREGEGFVLFIVFFLFWPLGCEYDSDHRQACQTPCMGCLSKCERVNGCTSVTDEMCL